MSRDMMRRGFLVVLFGGFAVLDFLIGEMFPGFISLFFALRTLRSVFFPIEAISKRAEEKIQRLPAFLTKTLRFFFVGNPSTHAGMIAEAVIVWAFVAVVGIAAWQKEGWAILLYATAMAIALLVIVLFPKAKTQTKTEI